MSIPAFSAQAALFDIRNLLGRDFPPDSPYRLFAETVYPMLVEVRPTLAACYRAGNGRPGIEPVLLLGISLLQFMERLPDRAAIEQVRLNLGWKLALNLELGLDAPDPSTLCNFRQRLLDHEQARVAFDAILQGLRRLGLVRDDSPQRIDSTHMLGAVARMSALDCLRQALRLALLEVEEAGGQRPPAWEAWHQHYVRTRLDYRMGAAALDQEYLRAGADMRALLDWAAQDASRSFTQMKLLERVFDEHFQMTDQGVEKLPQRPAGSVQNPHDPDAQCSGKGQGKVWIGYKTQVAETVTPGPRQPDEPTASFLTAIETQAATASDPAGLDQVEEAQVQANLPLPPQMHADGSYISAKKLHDFAAQGRELIGPALAPSHQRPGFTTEEFNVNVENRSATCPQGHPSAGCTRAANGEGPATFHFHWGPVCQGCPQQAACLGHTATSRGRELQVGEHHTDLQKRRQEQKTEEFQKLLKRRNAIEGTISELVRGLGMRQCRYRGLPKARLQNYFTGAACNIKRLVRRIGYQMRQAARKAGEVLAATRHPPQTPLAAG